MPASIAFIFLADPPADAKAFRPSADSSMWWGRRDSLVRISALSLFLSNGAPSPVCKDVVFVFNGEEKETATALSMTSKVCSGLTPTEFNIISLWKAAAKAGSNSLSSSPVICNYYPPAASSSSSSPQAADKRSLLRELQSSCPLSFLREWKLNGSEELILKKSSRGNLEAALAKWRASEQGGGHSGGQRRLERIFTDVLDRLISPSSGSSSRRTTLLLLHENYEQTLPIYSSSGAGDSSGDELIICLMGAVRDASDAEVAACLSAVAARNAPHPALSEARVAVASFNLGRTAEFTSKICAALCIHAMAGDLLEAVKSGASSAVALPPPKLPPARSGGWNWDGRGNKKVASASASVPVSASSLPDESARALRIVFVLRVPVSASELQQAILKSAGADDSSGGDSGRESLHGLVQAAVCALWRSRLGSEGAEAAADAASVGGGSVTPSVALVFRDNSLVLLTQAQICLELAAAHQAAPTEKQVLLAVEKRLRHPHVSAPFVSLSAALDAVLRESADVDAEWCRVSLKGVSPLWPRAPSAAPSNEADSPRHALSRCIYRPGKEREKGVPCGNFAFLFSSGEDEDEEKEEKEKVGDEWVRLHLIAGRTVSAGLGICGIVQWAHSMRLEAGVSRALHKAAKIDKKKRKKRKREGEEESS